MGKEYGSSLFRRLIRRQVMVDVSSNNTDKVSSNSKGSDSTTRGVDTSLVEMASSSWIDADSSLSSEEYVRYNRSLLSLQPWIFRKSDYKDDWERTGRNGDLLSPKNRGPQYKPGSSRGSLERRRSERYYVEPLNSVENCFMSHLCNEHLRIDEYVFSSPPSSPVSKFRPLLITDQNRIVSRSHYDSSGVQPGNVQHENAHGDSSSIPSETLFQKEAGGVTSGVLGTLIGVPPLPKSRKPGRKIREVQYGRLDIMDSQRSHKYPYSEGSPSGMLLFCLGISFGVMFTVLSNRIEVEKLNKSLKNSESLVQDLQEELEIKDSLTVKELVNETGVNQEVNHYYINVEESTDLFLDQNPSSQLTAQERDEYDSQHLHRPTENPQSLSKIQAELEAELERLEQSITTSDLQRRMSEFSELDPDLVGNVVQGELRAEMLDQGNRGGRSDGNSSTDGTSTTCTYNANYSVSPKELSLRLHEVIKIRLEERIKELETTLLENQRQLQVQVMEAERTSSQLASSNSDIGSSSSLESPTVLRPNGVLSHHPLCLNLSGDALYAYEEAYEEFTKITETENPPSSLKTSKWIDDGYWELDFGGGNKLVADNVLEREATCEPVLSIRESNGMIEGGQEYREGDVSDDEEGRKLIQQIMEKTRQGSPALLYAQRMLSLMDEII